MRQYTVFLYNVETRIDGSSKIFAEHFVRRVHIEFHTRQVVVRTRDSGDAWIYRFLDKLDRDQDWRLLVQLVGEGGYEIELTHPRLTQHTFHGDGDGAEHMIAFSFDKRLPIE